MSIHRRHDGRHANHALTCVRAAIDAQRAIHELNQKRTAENEGNKLENQARISAGLVAKPVLPILALGTGINSGTVTVGLMGSDAHIANADGSMIESQRVGGINLWATTNLLLNSTNWTKLTNPPFWTNGLLLWDDTDSTNLPSRFYRASEPH